MSGPLPPDDVAPDELDAQADALRTRLAEFRGDPAPAGRTAVRAGESGVGEGEGEEDDLPPDDEVPPGEGEGEGEAERVPGARTGEAARAPAPGAVEGEGEGEAVPPKLFSVEIPGLELTGEETRLVIDDLPQEYHDRIRQHVRRSEMVPALERELEGARTAQAVADFYEGQPLQAMHLVAREMPDVAEQFVRSWMRLNHDAVPAMIEEIGLDGDPRALKAERDLAAREQDDAVKEGQRFTRAQAQARAYAGEVERHVHGVIGELGLAGPDADDFYHLAERRIKDAAGARQRRYGDPWLPIAQVTQILESLVKRYLPPAAPQKGRAGAAAGEKPASVMMEEKLRRADKMRRALAGSGALHVKPGTMGKFKKGQTLDERLKLLRSGSL